MALRTGIVSLARHLRALRETAGELCLAAVEDRPAEPDVALVDRLEDRVTDLAGAVQEALDALVPLIAGPAERTALDLSRAGTALVRCQAGLDTARALFWDDLASYDALAGLVAFVQEQGGEWLGWMETVQESLRRCRAALADAGGAQSFAWQEVVDRAAAGGISLHATSIGQRLTMACGPWSEDGVQ